MWFIYQMEYYPAFANKGIIIFAGKWMEIGNIILSEVSQTQETCMVLYTLSRYQPELQNTLDTTTDYKKFNKKETPSKNASIPLRMEEGKENNRASGKEKPEWERAEAGEKVNGIRYGGWRQDRSTEGMENEWQHIAGGRGRQG